MLGFRVLRLITLLSGVMSFAVVGRAAWIETRIKGHTAVIDVDRNGSATVSHEFILGVRGGPLPSMTLEGVDSDAVIEPGASATPVVRYGVPTPIPLTLARGEDGVLRIEIEREKGLFTGTYAFRFRYQTALLGRDRIRRRGPSAVVEWIGPRFADGIDIAKVVFRLPESASLPALGASGDAGDADDAASMGSVFVAGVRHVDGKAEIELIRPHLARGEPAVWRVRVDPKSFDGLLLNSPGEPAPRAARAVPVERPVERMTWAALAAAIALGYALLVALKWACIERACVTRGALARSLLPLPIGMRASLAGALLAAAGVLGALGEYPTFAALLLLAAMAAAALRAPRARSVLRGPGQWLALTDSDAFSVPKRRLPGRHLDAGSRVGFSLFALGLTAFVGGAVFLSGRSPYHALCLLIAGSCLIPIFATARESSFPIHRAEGHRAWLVELKRCLANLTGLRVVAWARIPDGASEPDELRLLLRAAAGLDGLIGIEVGMEHEAGPGGVRREPFIILRARENSAAHQALAGRVRWQRGRRGDERVAVLRPPLPSVRATLWLLSELVAQLAAPTSAASTRSKKTRGVGSVTEKLGIRSPAHAT